MKLKMDYRYTLYACYFGYIVQGIINNISPILFVTYQKALGISVDKIGILIAVNFGVQTLIDIVSAKYVDRFGYRKSIIFAHIVSCLGILGIGILPFVMNPFLGLILATVLNGMGGGLLEVLVSPIAEASESEYKAKTMSLLHSFYCWGCVGFILISTLLLKFLGQRWYIMPLLWCIIPAVNIFAFGRVPMRQLVSEQEKIPFSSLARRKIFWVFMVLMLCAGASELSMAQWSSYFAEIGLNVNKTTGDLLGPCLFSVLMGLSRTFYGKKGDKIKLERFMVFSCVLCIASYMITVLSPVKIIALAGCALCGLSVGIMWPGVFSIAARRCRNGGTAMFAAFALAGDMGCIVGPKLVGTASEVFPQLGLKAGFAAAIVFPVLMLIFTIKLMKENDF